MASGKKNRRKPVRAAAQGHKAPEPRPSFSGRAMAALARHSRPLEALLLIAVIAVGVSFRLDDLTHWKQNQKKAFFDGQPLHTTFDAWFYLSLAQDLIDGTYNPVDEKRGVPDSPPRPSPPPLISVLAALAARLTTFSLSWIGAVLPVLLGPLLAVPLYFLGRWYGGPLAGFVAALMANIYPFYIYRSNIGRFDTDCMNVTWTACAAYLFLRFGTLTTMKRYAYCAGGVVTFGLFLWWWDQTPAVVGALTFLPLLVALAFFYRPSRTEGLLFYGLFALVATACLLVKGFDLPVQIAKSIWSQYLYISKDTGSAFPNIGITISEQSRPSLSTIVNYIGGTVMPASADLTETLFYAFPFLFAIGGVALLLWGHFTTGLFLISLLTLSVLALTYANRFIIFLIPVVALGKGYAMWRLWTGLKRFRPINIAVCFLLLALFVWPLYRTMKEQTQWPKEAGQVVAGMDAARRLTPPDAVIWAWWDHGYALTYYARRATVNDGSVHSGERTVYNAIPLTTHSFRLSANFMHFYVIRGIPGIRQVYRAAGNDKARGLQLIKDILAAGPEAARDIIAGARLKPVGQWTDIDSWLEFFYPPQKRPVYLFLDNLLPRTAYWWYWFGSWDVAKQTGQNPRYNVVYNLGRRGDMIVGSNGVSINTADGTLTIGGRRTRISNLAVRKKNTLQTKQYANTSGLRFEMIEPARFGAIMDADIAESVFNKLYIRHRFPKQYFRPVRLSIPYYQLWEVRSDSLARAP